MGRQPRSQPPPLACRWPAPRGAAGMSCGAAAPLWRARLATPRPRNPQRPRAHACRRAASAGGDRPRPARGRRRSPPHLRRASRHYGWSEHSALGGVGVHGRVPINPWRAVAGFSPGDRTISFVEDLEEVGLRRCRTPAEPPQHGSPAGSIERGRSRRSAASAGCADSDMRAEAPRQQHNTSTCFDRRAGGAADDGDRLPARAAGGRCENRE